MVNGSSQVKTHYSYTRIDDVTLHGWYVKDFFFGSSVLYRAFTSFKAKNKKI